MSTELGTLVVDGLALPIVEIRFAGGALEFTGKRVLTEAYTENLRPVEYEVYGADGALVYRSRLPGASAYMKTLYAGDTLAYTVKLDMRNLIIIDRETLNAELYGSNQELLDELRIYLNFRAIGYR